MAATARARTFSEYFLKLIPPSSAPNWASQDGRHVHVLAKRMEAVGQPDVDARSRAMGANGAKGIIADRDGMVARGAR